MDAIDLEALLTQRRLPEAVASKVMHSQVYLWTVRSPLIEIHRQVGLGTLKVFQAAFTLQ